MYLGVQQIKILEPHLIKVLVEACHVTLEKLVFFVFCFFLEHNGILWRLSSSDSPFGNSDGFSFLGPPYGSVGRLVLTTAP